MPPASPRASFRRPLRGAHAQQRQDEEPQENDAASRKSEASQQEPARQGERRAEINDHGARQAEPGRLARQLAEVGSSFQFHHFRSSGSWVLEVAK